MFTLSDFDYHLPPHLIAQLPARSRDLSRLLVLERASGIVRHGRFSDVTRFLRKGDLLILNDTKVMPARLTGRRRTGGQVEILLLRKAGEKHYESLIKPLGRLKDKEEIFFQDGSSCRLADAKAKIIEFRGANVGDIMRRVGLVPLPPYIRRKPLPLDRARYQTVFARAEGAVAAPTAGLHFTRRLLDRLKQQGVGIAFLTLHVNYATFSPVRAENVKDHRMQAEEFSIPETTVSLVRRAKKEKRRVVAVGTTVCKALEDSHREIEKNGPSGVISKMSRLFIHPPFSFKVVDALITNFHLPRTTLLMLVAAFAGRDLIFKAYQEAIKEDYRFYSYGDAMLIV